MFYDQRFSVPHKFLSDYWLEYWATAPKELITSGTAWSREPDRGSSVPALGLVLEGLLGGMEGLLGSLECQSSVLVSQPMNLEG